MTDELTLPTPEPIPASAVDPAGMPTFSGTPDPALQDTIERTKKEGLGAADYFLGEHRSKTTVGAAAERSDFQAAAGIVARDPVYVPGTDTTPADFGLEPVFAPVKDAQFEQRRQQALDQIYRQAAYETSPPNRTLTNLAAGAAGAFADPINFTGFQSWLVSQWPMGFQAGKLATTAMEAGLSNVVSDIATQMTRTVSGAQEHFDPAQAVEAFPVGLTMGTILHGAVHGAVMLGRRMFFGAPAQKAPGEAPGAPPAAERETGGGQVPSAEATAGEAVTDNAAVPATAASPEPATPPAPEGSPAPAGPVENPPPAPSEGLRLKRAPMPDEVPPEARNAGDAYFELVDKDGTSVGEAFVNAEDEQNLVLHLVRTWDDKPNSLGPAQVRGLLRQLRTFYPQAEKIVADRVSGARTGGTHDNAAGVPIEINLPKVREAAADILEHTDGDRAAAIEAVTEQIDQGRTLSRDEHGETVPAEEILQELQSPTQPEPTPAKLAEPVAQAASRAEDQPLGRRERIDLLRTTVDQLRAETTDEATLHNLDAYQRDLEAELGASRAEHVEAELQDAFGTTIQDRGVVKVVQSVEDLPARPDGVPHPEDVRGMFDGQHAYVVADNVAPGEAKGVVLHEVGVHYGLRGLLGDDLHAQVLAEVRDRALSGRPEDRAFARAAAAVPADTPLEHVPEEILAYLVEHAPEVGLVKRLYARLRQAVYRLTGGLVVNLTEQDLRQMAVAALRRAEAPGGAAGEALYAKANRDATVRLSLADTVAAAHETKDWADWYDRYQADLVRLFGRDTEIVKKMLSATSQAASVPANVGLALKAYRQWLSGEPFTGYLPAVIKNLERIRDDVALAGQKIAEYGKANSGGDEGIAVDRHIAELFFDTKAPTAAQVASAKAHVKAVAAELGWKPRDVQAALWAYNQIRKGAKPQSYDTYLKAKAAEIEKLRAAHGRTADEGVRAGGPADGAPRGPEAEAGRLGRGAGDGARGEPPGPRSDVVPGATPGVVYSRRKYAQGENLAALQQDLAAQGDKVVRADELDRLVEDARQPRITLHDMIGMTVIPTIADRTAAGALYTGIDGSKLEMAVPLLGGHMFPFRTSNLENDVVWANRGKGVTTFKLGKGATHMLVLLGDADMHQSNTTVANAYMATLEAYLRDGRVTPANVSRIEDIIRASGVVDEKTKALAASTPDAADKKAIKKRDNALKLIATKEPMLAFPGFADKEALATWIDKLSFESRNLLTTTLGNKKALNLGAPNMAKVLDATRDVNYASGRWGDGVVLLEIDQKNPLVELGTQGTLPHPDYPYGIRGRVVGRFDTPVNYETLWQDWLREDSAAKIAKGTAPEDLNPRRAFELSKPALTITPELVQRIGTVEAPGLTGYRHARALADFAANRWKQSGVDKNKGGISPQGFLDQLSRSEAKATLSEYTLKDLNAKIDSGDLKVYQLGEADIWFGLDRTTPWYAGDFPDIAQHLDPHEVTLVSVVNNEQGARGLAAPAIMTKALEEGATLLDAFAVRSAKYPDGLLPSLYAKYGFEKVGSIPFDPAFYSPTKLKDAEFHWRKSGWTPDQGYPDLVVMKWRGTDADRAGLTERFIRDGFDAVRPGGARPDVAAAETEFVQSLARQAGRAEGRADTGGSPGLVGAGRDERATGPGGGVRTIARLSDTGLANLGLTAADRDAARAALGDAHYSRRGDTPLDNQRLAERLRELHAHLEEGPDGKLLFRTQRGTKRSPVRPNRIVDGRPTEHQGTTGGRAQRLEELGVDLAKGFGLIHDDQRAPVLQALLPQDSASAARVGRLAPNSMGALGQFSEKTGIARIRTPDELQALVHEVGHKFDQENRADVDALLQANADELRTTYGAQKTDKERKELWSSVLEDYALSRKYLQKQAPNTAAQLEQMLAQKHPQQAAALDRLRQDLDALHAATPGELVVLNTLAQEHPGMLDAWKEAVAKDVAPTGDTLYTVVDALETASLDKNHPVYRAVEDLRDAVQKKTGRRIDLLPQDDAYKLAREVSSARSAASYMIKHGVRAADSYEATGPSLMDGVHTAIGANYTDADWQRFGAYLTARRMVAEYARFQSGELKRPPGPLSLATYQAAVAELEAAHPTFAAGAVQIYAFQMAYLKRLLDKGIITRKFFDAAIAKVDYVPAVRDRSALIKGKRVTNRSPGGMLRTSIMQRFRGSDRAVLNPLDSIAKRVHDYEQLIARNDSNVALAKLAEVAGTDGAMIFEPIPNSQLIPHRVDVIQALRTAGIQQGLDRVDLEHLLLQAQDAFDGHSPVGTLFNAAPLMHEGGEPIVYYWVNGERRAGRLADGRFGQELHQAMTGMNESERSWFLSVLQISAQALRSGVTKNPVFVLTNMINDQFSAAGTAGRRYIPFVSAMSGLLDAVHAEIYGQASARGKRAHAYAATGGLAAGAVTEAIEHGRFGLDARSGLRERSFVQKVLLPGKDTLHMLGRLYEASEGGTRLGLFASYLEQGKQMGLDDFNATKYAWYKTQDYMDFRKAGAKMSLLNRSIPFLNAHMQGLTRELKALGDIGLWAKSFRGEAMTAQEIDRLKDARIAWIRVMAIGAVLGTYQTVGNWAHPEFQTGPDYTKDSNYLLKVGDHWIAIPKGFGVVRSIVNAFQRGAEYAIRRDPTVLTHWLYSTLDTIKPPTNNPLVSLLYDVPANYDRFRERQIVPFYMQGWDPEKQASLTTSGLAKAIAHVADSYLGRAWSPMKIDYIINNLGGTGARDLLKTVDTLMSGESASKQIYDWPLVQRFVKNLERGSEAQSAFNELVGQQVGRLEQKASAYKGMIDAGQTSAAGEYLRDMDEDERIWTLMQKYGDARAGEKRMHPLLNAREQVNVIHGLQRQLNNGAVIKKEDIDTADATRSKRDAKPIALDADTRAQLLEEMQSLNNGVARNAMVAVGAKGSAGLPIIDTAPIEQRIQLLSPELAHEYQARIKNTLDAEKVRALWPQVKARVLEDGDLFSVTDLAKQARRRKH